MSYICKFCQNERLNYRSLINHERLCKKNPNHQENPMKGRKAWNKGLTKETSDIVYQGSEKSSVVMKKMFSENKLCATGAGAWTKEQRKEHALKTNFGGYRERAGRSKKFYVLDSYGNKVCLQSSYEYEIYEILVDQNIKWFRPKALMYSGKRYFADFYLPEFDVYLDPKNDYKAIQDESKIREVSLQNKVKIFVILKKEFEEIKASLPEWLGARPIIVYT